MRKAAFHARCTSAMKSASALVLTVVTDRRVVFLCGNRGPTDEEFLHERAGKKIGSIDAIEGRRSLARRGRQATCQTVSCSRTARIGSRGPDGLRRGDSTHGRRIDHRLPQNLAPSSSTARRCDALRTEPPRGCRARNSVVGGGGGSKALEGERMLQSGLHRSA